MRKFLRLAIFGIAMLVQAAMAFAAGEFVTKAKNAILVDSRSGTVFFEKNADELIEPASMSKIMTMLIVFEGLRNGSLRPDDEFVISADAWRRGGAPSGSSTMYAKVNSRIKLKDLIRGVIIQSANDAAIAIAEGISGSEEAFAEKMTARARELGLTRSVFRNATGLPDPEHLVTVRELSQLTRYLIEVFPEYYKIYSEPEFTWNNIRQGNRNPLLGKYPGADGVKTGHTKSAGYGLVGSAKRDGRRLILVLAGMRSKGERAREAIKLMDWGFRKFARVGVFRQGELVSSARVWGGNANWVNLVAKHDIVIRLSKQERAKASMKVVYDGPLKAPVKQGSDVASLIISVNGRTIATSPLVADKTIPRHKDMWSNALDTLMFRAFGG